MGILMLRETARLGFWLHTAHPQAQLIRQEIRRTEREAGADRRLATAEQKRARRRERNVRIKFMEGVVAVARGRKTRNEVRAEFGLPPESPVDLRYLIDA